MKQVVVTVSKVSIVLSRIRNRVGLEDAVFQRLPSVRSHRSRSSSTSKNIPDFDFVRRFDATNSHSDTPRCRQLVHKEDAKRIGQKYLRCASEMEHRFRNTLRCRRSISLAVSETWRKETLGFYFIASGRYTDSLKCLLMTSVTL